MKILDKKVKDIEKDKERNYILKEINKIILKYKNYIKEAYLFGSYARGDYNKYSDIDLAIYFKDYDKYFDFLEEFENIYTIRKFDIHNLAYCNFYFDIEEVKGKNAIKLY